jgi:hypothetical protein
MIYLSEIYLFPSGLLIFILILFIAFREKKPLILTPFIVYAIILFSALISGIALPLYFSAPSIFFYQSPVRLAHLGVILNFFTSVYIVSYFFEKRSGNKCS